MADEQSATAAVQQPVAQAAQNAQQPPNAHMAQGAPQQRREHPPRGPRDENTIFIGKKGVMGYVLSVVTQFNNGSPHVSIKARGKLISRAVDVAEIVRNRFMPDAKIKSIEIKTEELQSEDGSMSKVSAIDITLTK